MIFTIHYTDKKTGLDQKLEIEPTMDVLSIRIPEQPSLPAIKVNVNSDAVLIDTDKRELGIFLFDDLISMTTL